MLERRFIWMPLLVGSGIALAACAPASNRLEAGSEVAAVAAVGVGSAGSAKTLPVVQVHKSPTCGCCAVWVDHLRAAGFPVEVHNEDNLNPLKERLGIPYGKGSCHTAVVGGYVIEGHVPAQDIKRLLAESPDAKGLVLPGMPLGSPGMESPDGRSQPYTVELIGLDGSTNAFSQH
ncbi:DUF411 domain-containing protein [Lysobacter soli]|uniref:DUF411 domain-containing protein n=1 Tax=Lysobacter soli TaxID=453783 RepID=UPI00209D849F|nr:DUF411 domain-containing protein [Lysobacter soli]UTA55603.1 DUF411 domain-containing protein [Lysobacter soli]